MPICCGCFIRDSWLNMYMPPPYWGQPPYSVKMPHVYTVPPQGPQLTELEKSVLALLTAAYASFLELDGKHEDDDSEFKQHIHALQSAIALRVARRTNPEIWQTPPSE
jgi:SMC interacting uncharacterized protein involved in chromosome segregation